MTIVLLLGNITVQFKNLPSKFIIKLKIVFVHQTLEILEHMKYVLRCLVIDLTRILILLRCFNSINDTYERFNNTLPQIVKIFLIFLRNVHIDIFQTDFASLNQDLHCLIKVWLEMLFSHQTYISNCRYSKYFNFCIDLICGKNGQKNICNFLEILLHFHS